MPSKVRFDFDRDGIRHAALTSPEIRGAVRQVAERIAGNARAQTGDEIVVNEGGRSRARAYVTRLGSGAQGEANDRVLGRSAGSA